MNFTTSTSMLVSTFITTKQQRSPSNNSEYSALSNQLKRCSVRGCSVRAWLLVVAMADLKCDVDGQLGSLLGCAKTSIGPLVLRPKVDCQIHTHTCDQTNSKILPTCFQETIFGSCGDVVATENRKESSKTQPRCQLCAVVDCPCCEISTQPTPTDSQSMPRLPGQHLHGLHRLLNSLSSAKVHGASPTT